MGGMLPPTSMVGVTLTGLDLGVCSNVVGRVQWAFRRVSGGYQRAIHALIDAVGSREMAAGVGG